MVDLIVAHALLKFQQNDLLLVLWKPIHEAHDARESILVLRLLIRCSFLTRELLPAQFIDGFDTPVLAQYVKAAIPANGEQPSAQVLTQFFRILFTETDKSVLHDIAGAVEIMYESPSITNEGGFVFLDRSFDEFFEFSRFHRLAGCGITALLCNAMDADFLRKKFSAALIG